ncbi:hypothetical protein [Flagellimonas profundi]|uniref:Uncharacterized protein n=1 Tax=Flagellimonas profundi TaxID=2915620 RepID=A0ABS3FEB1_9FLAO|nr:hypothetical protein [Allomuricauda profundi]MBO0341495.1 hypothetical protein [Allomuricauda profundi]|tara:strand:+ start:2784 stop:3014 length:231 start_codon:yes stop_codon:yes gene_type:complete
MISVQHKTIILALKSKPFYKWQLLIKNEDIEPFLKLMEWLVHEGLNARSVAKVETFLAPLDQGFRIPKDLESIFIP